MSIDLNQAGEQQTGSSLVIPPKSKVQVQLSIIYPEAGRAGASAPELTRAHSGLEYLATKLTVTRGTFAGKVIYQNYNLAGAQTTGQQKAIDISVRSIRAMVEASRGVSPKDSSPTATGPQAPALVRTGRSDLLHRGGLRTVAAFPLYRESLHQQPALLCRHHRRPLLSAAHSAGGNDFQ